MSNRAAQSDTTRHNTVGHDNGRGAAATKGTSGLTATTRCERSSAAWERSPAAMDPPGAGEVKARPGHREGKVASRGGTCDGARERS